MRAPPNAKTKKIFFSSKDIYYYGNSHVNPNVFILGTDGDRLYRMFSKFYSVNWENVSHC